MMDGGNMTDERIKLAEVAIEHGRTRDQFIRDNASPDADKFDLQGWSDAYSKAMRHRKSDNAAAQAERRAQREMY